MKKIWLLILIFALIITACSHPTVTIIQETGTTTTSDVTKPTLDTDKVELDLAIVNAIKAELGKASDYELTDEDLAQITYLAIFDEPVKSLHGISKLVNLRELHISSGTIEDISELALLQDITFIDISNCNIREIPDLSDCSQLESLYLGNNLIEDVSPLTKIDSLKSLNLDSNRITSIKSIENCDKLEFFTAMGNCILDYNNIEDNDLINAFNSGSQVEYIQHVQVENRAKEYAESIPSGLSDEKIVSIIYQYVIDSMEFDNSVRPFAAFGYDGLFNGKGVCGDYAEMFAILSNHAGVECYVCVSETHAWNIAKIDGKYYHFDTLWDEPEDEWKHFKVSSEYIRSLPDHVYDVSRYPICE